MTDIILFNQYFTTKKKSSSILALMPINLLCLGSYLKSKNMDCKIYELGLNENKPKLINDRYRYGLDDEKISEILQKEKPKIVGVGCMYSQHYIDVVNICRLIKRVNPEISVVIGGNHATTFSEMVIKENSIDYVVRGEGEITFYELCRSIITNKLDNLIYISGLTYKEKENGINTKDRALIKDIDSLPDIDYTLVDLDFYFYKSQYTMRYPFIGIISSRGCPGKCIFCTVKAVWGRKWRGRNPIRTVDEIEYLHKKYGIKEFSFLDDSAAVNKNRWVAICDEIINRKLNIRWTTPNGIAHWTLDKSTLLKMKKAGCYRITFGIESGNLNTRKYIRKNHSLKQAKEMIKYANKIGMWTICTHIIGFPYENIDSINDTINFAMKSGTDFATFFLLSPQVTSDVYEHFKIEDLLNFDHIFEDNVLDENKYEEMYNTLNDGGIPTKYFSPKDIKQIQMNAYKKFIIYRAFTFLNPFRIIRKIRSFEDFKYALNLILKGIKIFIKSFHEKTTRSLLWD